MSESFGWTINLVNSVIGVSLLSMPYCFKKCGIVLSVVLIMMSAVLNRFSCYLLLKSSLMAKRRNYELLAFHVFGSTGKLMVELSVLGFLLGTCIAFFVVIGDIGPSLVAHLLGVTNGPQLRAFVMTVLGMFVALPLGLLRRIDSLTSFSTLSLALYLILVLKMLSEAMSSISNQNAADVWQQINYWDSSHVFSSLPIFSMALSCQTQLFAIFDASLVHNADIHSLQRLKATVDRSLNICSAIYISVGICGYIAFSGQAFGGNILIHLPSGFISTFTLIAFVFTVLISFPLCLFPCRTSLHSLLSRKGSSSLLNTTSSSIHMSDRHFRLLTVVLIVTTIGISILLPHIELVLGILGSTIGAVICFIFPALIYLNLTSKNTTERLMAQLVVITGTFILIICTLSTLHDIYFSQSADIDVLDSAKSISINSLNNEIIPKIDIKVKETKEVMKEMKDKSHRLIAEQKPPLPSFDANKAKRQEELLQRLEKQQMEHKKLLEQQKELFNEMKKHNELYHSLETNKLVVDDKNPRNGSIDEPKKVAIPEIISNDSKQSFINQKNILWDKPMVYSAIDKSKINATSKHSSLSGHPLNMNSNVGEKGNKKDDKLSDEHNSTKDRSKTLMDLNQLNGKIQNYLINTTNVLH